MIDIKVILKYRREEAGWVCPDCDTENILTSGRCSVCGYRKSGGENIVKAWSPDDEVRNEPVVKAPPKTPVRKPETKVYEDTESRYNDYPGTTYDEGNGAGPIKVIIGILVFIIFIMAFFVFYEYYAFDFGFPDGIMCLNTEFFNPDYTCSTVNPVNQIYEMLNSIGG